MLTAILLCMATTLAALGCLKRFAPHLGLLEHPRGHRTHELPTPVVGGVGMAAGLFVTWLAPNPVEPSAAVTVGALGLVLIGVHDDRRVLRARAKFLAQFCVVTAAAAFGGDLLRTSGKLLRGIELRLAMLALPFTVFAVLGLINAVNMLDGLDGLAGTIALVAFGWLAACMWMVEGTNRLGGNLAIFGAISVFLLFNARLPGRPRALMFMGDTGSMLLGYLLAIAAIAAATGLAGVTGWRQGVPDWIMFASLIVIGLAYHQGCRIAWRDLRAREAAVAVAGAGRRSARRRGSPS
ncbi:MAG: undecaprenyl/decaprenyl-phosphate alpha-N-acetylglucosaminyl 1-phosphate transferase [Burkholderiaceae bacterium]|jgi:UDP-GlcNAc:undecaprenyl-phosphate GlcNAc-1-phosphate transferase|nr:undecaprenyl/decaprenyl-phosphate alpha-N-acetylglucosaminyl 1-phosphate transferase [Burkholderiaceae bacterium]